AGAIGTRDRVRLAWRLALGRSPRATEMRDALEHLERETARATARRSAEGGNDGRPAEIVALASLCHVLLNTNEYLFVD
ncbi:MAG: hypothetical protein JNL97_11640, partial [Verrucomicrobiales bacterium]|nr:hypothetical protein [Verrucomicrobiales bacterium]